MSRIDTSHWHSKSKHEHTMIALWDVVYRLRTCLNANVPIDPTTRLYAIFAIDVAEHDIWRCTTNLDDMRKGGIDRGLKGRSPVYIHDHAHCATLMAEIRIALKQNIPYDSQLLDNLEAEINKLESCREGMISYRHVRGRGYVK